MEHRKIPMLDYDRIETDLHSACCLPPYPIAISTYHKFRLEGDAPAQALRKTLEMWHEFWMAARPSRFFIEEAIDL